jgi:hypothetical protein
MTLHPPSTKSALLAAAILLILIGVWNVDAFLTSSIQRGKAVFRLSPHEASNNVDPFPENGGIPPSESRRQILSKAGEMMFTAGLATLIGTPSAFATDTKVSREWIANPKKGQFDAIFLNKPVHFKQRFSQ